MKPPSAAVIDAAEMYGIDRPFDVSPCKAKEIWLEGYLKGHAAATQEGEELAEALEKIATGPTLPMTKMSPKEMANYVASWSQEIARKTVAKYRGTS